MNEEYKDLEKLWKFELINKVLFLQQQLKDKDDKIKELELINTVSWMED